MKANERDRLIKIIDKKDLALIRRKGHDYSGNEDCLSNLRVFGFVGCVVRLTDKVFRLIQFIKQGHLEVKDESILDTLADARNYLRLAEILFLEEKQNKTNFRRLK